jgi:hypothetical protein
MTPEHKLALKVILSVVAGIAGVIGAIFWWIGSTISKQGMEPFVHWKRIPMSRPTDPHQIDTYPYLERIGWWNKYAAVATAISVLASTGANFL